MVQCKKKKINYKLKKVIDTPKKDWIIVPNTHEPIIEKDLFFKAQELLKSKEKTRNKSVDYLLRGLVYCKECGKKLGTTTDTHSKKNGKGTDNTEVDNNAGIHSTETYGTRYLRCSSYATAPLQRICTPHLMNYEKLESTVIDMVREDCQRYLDSQISEKTTLENNDKLDQETQLKKEKSILSKAIEILELQIDKIYDDKLSGLISNQDFLRIYDKKISERDFKKQKLKELENTENFRSNFDTQKLVLEFLESTDITSVQLTSLIDKIEVNEAKKICITYKVIHSFFMS